VDALERNVQIIVSHQLIFCPHPVPVATFIQSIYNIYIVQLITATAL